MKILKVNLASTFLARRGMTVDEPWVVKWRSTMMYLRNRKG